MRNLYDKSSPKTIQDPAIDDLSEFYSFFAKPNMQLGLPGENSATRVDYDGQIDTGFGKYQFYLGESLEKVEQRIWTLSKGYLPEINYDIRKENAEFKFRIFQFWVENKAKSQNKVPITFVQVEIENITQNSQKILIYFGLLFNQFKHKVVGLKRPKFDKNWSYSFEGADKAYRSNKLLYVINRDQHPNGLYSLLIEDFKSKKRSLVPFENIFQGREQRINSDTPVLLQEYKFQLAQGEKKILIFKVPQSPPDKSEGALIDDIQNADINQYREKFTRYWEDILRGCASILVSEEKAINTSKASLIYNFMCQNFHENGTMEQHVNRFQYNAFWLRDSAYFSKMYSIFNRTDLSKRLLQFFLTKQNNEGNFISQRGQFDGWGQSLWSFGEYVKYSDDNEFATFIFPYVMQAIRFFEKTIQKDDWGIMPPVFAADNEMICGRYTVHNLWAWCGLNNANYLANFLNKREEADLISKVKGQFLERFLPILNKVCEKTKDRVPPGLDTDLGVDWGNLLMLYPQKLLDKSDPKIVTTLKDYREKKYQEGLATWMVFLHHYVTERIAQQHLILGDQELALRDFYSMLSHTGSCHEGFEHNIRPWGNRHFLIPIRKAFVRLDYYNFPPHGWFAVAYNTLLRNMLLREEDNDLHLLSAISPEWIYGPIQVENINTYFGTCHLQLDPTKILHGVHLAFRSKFERGKPERIVVHIPYFVNKKTIEINSDVSFKVDDEKTQVILSPNEEFSTFFTWEIDSKFDLSYLSYDKAVKWLKEEYKKRFRQAPN